MATGSECAKCGGPLAVDSGEIAALGIRLRIGVLCEKCDALRCAEDESRAAVEREGQLEAEWQRMCPASYSRTDPNHSDLDRQTLREVLAWKPNAEGIGLGLHGGTGAGKTRMCWLLLKQLHFAGVKVAAIRATSFAGLVAKQFSDDADEKSQAKRRLKKLVSVPVLFIDDLGKERFTARVETELYELVEERTSQLLPIVFTTQLAASSLASMLSKENADAILGRLKEFCDFLKCEPVRSRGSNRRTA